MTPDDLNALIQDCVDALADDRWRDGIEAMNELVHLHKLAGMENALPALHQEIWTKAIRASENDFFTENFVEEMKKYREEKQGLIIIH